LGKRVLEIGCGEGYGSNYLAGFSGSVIAIDYDASAIEHAKSKYHKKNLAFRQMDIKNLGYLKEKFDTVCCFQVIEHIENTDRFLNDIKQLLADGGVFIVSTCNKRDSSPGSDIPLNKFHVREYFFDDFRKLLEGHFSSVKIAGLKRSARLNFYRRLKKIGILKGLYVNAGPGSFKIVTSGLDDALDFIAVCKK
jgi:cyclopropane fatty-acyl-phospholipid synthase-like methyltransferase